MKHAKPSKVYRTILVVEGAGSFPIDMLRYDACCPNTGDDSDRLEKDDPRCRRRITLRRFSINGLPATVPRWRLFGWDVVSEEPVP